MPCFRTLWLNAAAAACRSSIGVPGRLATSTSDRCAVCVPINPSNSAAAALSFGTYKRPGDLRLMRLNFKFPR